ncbi:MAG: hypothetical protein ABI758_00150 [Candidatus Woesebacteria bacterium]
MKQAEQYVRDALSGLESRELHPGIALLESHQFRTTVDHVTYDLVAEMLRIYSTDTQSMVFRAISRNGIESLLLKKKPRIALDNRPNIEAEVNSGGYDQNILSDAYISAYCGRFLRGTESEADVILTPVREGAMGPTDSAGGYGPFTSTTQRYAEHNWDLEEEKLGGGAWEQFLRSGDIKPLYDFRDEITRHHEEFALPLATFLQAEIQTLFTDLHIEPFSPSTLEEGSSFLETETIEHKVSLGHEHFSVDQIIAYPYSTKNGIVYIRLFRVWDEAHATYEVVRTIQTEPKKIGDPSMKNFDSLRLDSGCHDGMHSLDCHCDCPEQLEQVIKESLLMRDDTLIVQLTDHEGKGWGTIWKGRTLDIMRRHNDEQDPTGQEGVRIGNPIAAAALYGALGVPPDRRDYHAAQAVLKIFNIKHVSRLLMGNQDKIQAIASLGIHFQLTEAVTIHSDDHLGDEARQGLEEKHNGVVSGLYGKVLYRE